MSANTVLMAISCGEQRDRHLQPGRSSPVPSCSTEYVTDQQSQLKVEACFASTQVEPGEVLDSAESIADRVWMNVYQLGGLAEAAVTGKICAKGLGEFTTTG